MFITLLKITHLQFRVYARALSQVKLQSITQSQAIWVFL